MALELPMTSFKLTSASSSSRREVLCARTNFMTHDLCSSTNSVELGAMAILSLLGSILAGN